MTVIAGGLEVAEVVAPTLGHRDDVIDLSRLHLTVRTPDQAGVPVPAEDPATKLVGDTPRPRACGAAAVLTRHRDHLIDTS